MSKVIDQNMVGYDVKKLMEIVRALATASKSTRERIYANNADTRLSQDYRTELEKNEKASLIGKTQGQLESVSKLIADIKIREEEYDNILDIDDPILQGALNIVKTAGAEVITADTTLIIEKLAGHRRALDILHSAFDKAGVVVEHGKEYFYNTYALCETYEKAIANVLSDPYRAECFGEAERASRKLVRVLGIDNVSDAELSCGWSREDLVEATMIERSYISPEDLKQAL